jgi:hypothetical protein
MHALVRKFPSHSVTPSSWYQVFHLLHHLRRDFQKISSDSRLRRSVAVLSLRCQQCTTPAKRFVKQKALRAYCSWRVVRAGLLARMCAEQGNITMQTSLARSKLAIDTSHAIPSPPGFVNPLLAGGAVSLTAVAF